jgi:DNA-binding transcriptional LysR family regulator
MRSAARIGRANRTPAMDRITGIQLFIRIVESASFSKAAEELHMTQPTATKHVAALEKHLGARLLNRNSRSISATEIGALYYQKCKTIQREIEEADNLAILLQSRLSGTLRVSTSVSFGRRVLTPLVLHFMCEHADLSIDLSFDDRYVNLVEQGVDIALRMGRLADSALGSRYLGVNPWLIAASPEYLARCGEPLAPQDLARHACLVYSSVQGDDRWQFNAAAGDAITVQVRGPLRSNDLAAVLAAACAGHGVAALPWYVAREGISDGSIRQVLHGFALPAQELHAVYPSPKLLPSKVATFIAYLQAQLADTGGLGWWLRDINPGALGKVSGAAEHAQGATGSIVPTRR